ncbi:2-polyprenylphenol 6-hydroxylase [Lentilitoribacter sp. EG35]|uniref:2-polyprenylphenol 6-hydroxylase n=1 Tax=Lentilitoribacter sp. EG35 TaxID=3234192 RepID=UPI003460353B
MASIGTYLRLVRDGWVLVREGVVSELISKDMGRQAMFISRLAGLFARSRKKNNASDERSDRLARGIAKLGPSYVKLGQFLATRADVVGTDIAADLGLLQDQMAPFAKDLAIKKIEESLGRSIDKLYDVVEEPIAAASVAQVHPAIVTDNEVKKKLAVKVIRPGVRIRFRHDLEVFYLVSHLQEKFIPAARRLRPVEVTQTLEQTTKIEMDLRLEAAALSEIAENTKDDPDFRVPIVDWERTGRDVLTMEWIDGTKMSDIDGLKAAGHDLNHIAEVLIQSFLRHTLRDGFFHADMHQGNLFVDKDGCLVAVDMGIVGRLGFKERRFLAEIIFGFITRDYMRVAQVHFDAGYVAAKHNVASFAQAIRAIGEPIHGQSAETISMAKLLTLLFEVTELFDMEARSELVMLQKTMVVVEGVARTLNPNFNMWKASESVVSEWIRSNLGPARFAADAKDGLIALHRLGKMAPEIAMQAEKMSSEISYMTEHGLRFDEQTAKNIGKAEAHYARGGRWALWVIAISLAMMAYSSI